MGKTEYNEEIEEDFTEEDIEAFLRSFDEDDEIKRQQKIATRELDEEIERGRIESAKLKEKALEKEKKYKNYFLVFSVFCLFFYLFYENFINVEPKKSEILKTESVDNRKLWDDEDEDQAEIFLDSLSRKNPDLYYEVKDRVIQEYIDNEIDRF